MSPDRRARDRDTAALLDEEWRFLSSPVRHGTCLDCGDEWSERDEIVVCPECHSLNVCEDIPL